MKLFLFALSLTMASAAFASDITCGYHDSRTSAIQIQITDDGFGIVTQLKKGEENQELFRAKITVDSSQPGMTVYDSADQGFELVYFPAIAPDTISTANA